MCKELILLHDSVLFIEQQLTEQCKMFLSLLCWSPHRALHGSPPFPMMDVAPRLLKRLFRCMQKLHCKQSHVVASRNGGSNCTNILKSKECVDFLDQRKQAKMQWIQDRSRSNVDSLNNIRRDASRHFRNKKKAYLKVKTEELETNSKIKVRDLYRGINDFKKGYQPRTTIVKARVYEIQTYMLIFALIVR